ncbi:VCBS repeat-containing protein [Archangium sp.]|uniref:FG-GAP repeat domain-containing protein n=1 Tax=Archangium sp. TaxID=1872627 RepID=UPI00286AB118|nr:VCBS repeat-containing protein [Archangium sp.]
MAKMKLLSKLGCLVAASGLVAGCGVEPGTESDAQPVSEVRQAIANGKRFNTFAEPAEVAARADLQIYRHSDNISYMRRTADGVGTGYTLGRAAALEDVPVQGNFDGDSLYDVATYRPSTAEFAVRRSATGTYYTFGYGTGSSGALPAVGDFDGDGITDHAIWRNGSFLTLRSTDFQYSYATLGQCGDIPVIGNYDGDTKDDYAVWRPSTRTWYYISSATGAVVQYQYGYTTDVPVVGDFDGDGKTDFTLFRPSTGTWYIRSSLTRVISTKTLGLSTDYPVPADYDGDGKTDVAVWRPSDGNHHMIYSGNGAQGSMQYGISSDVPANTNVYCKNIAGLVRPCNAQNVDTSLMCGSIAITVDDTYDLYKNGVLLGSGNDWTNTETYKVGLTSGDVVAVRARDTAGLRVGLLANIQADSVLYESGSAWKCTATLYSGWNTTGYSDAAWPLAVEYGANNGEAFWSQRNGISTSAQWIWTSAGLGNTTVYCRFTIP